MKYDCFHEEGVSVTLSFLAAIIGLGAILGKMMKCKNS
ncbi:hypothetical protein DKK79_07270 [Gilliamella apicola]|uniref:Uncharacterized protein n=1 Tax=Gilliamella apicola TaxID=1196095 RepID=A0A2V4DXA2_9GAMM|nr:hypothetical protein DKK79_07270 [Gilliamella apicola]